MLLKTAVLPDRKDCRGDEIMGVVAVNEAAPDISLEDFQGRLFHLSDYQGKMHVLLVLNRGFS